MQPDVLKQLHDIQLPEAVSGWPPAPGWWVLALFACLLLAGLGYALRRWYLRGRAKRAALQQLKCTWKNYQQEQHSLSLVRDIERLLKQVALCYYPRQEVAHLTGQPWLAFLDRTGHTAGFSRGIGHWLGDAVYKAELPPHQPAQLQALVDLAKEWIKQQ